ncbi:RAS guanyl-releasing protein 4 isoform X6 [Tupaia chinensis]|uniref:RAS guanyl-releasing protein 4 isoform X6 n=1 Tax=Tupaia chinensis TaxID=246437 RepID=UPI000FFBD9E8|nr:RAS guanyl-releasing protein 4 isoform X6 [Tupaia chinensis]
MNRKDSKRSCAHRKSHQECMAKTAGRCRPRQARRHKTCPSPREISKVMESMNLGVLSEGGCSEDELLEKCIQSFDSTGSLRRGDYILNMMLAMHSWVLPSANLAARLLALYQKATGDTQERRRLQICHLVRYWLANHPEAVHQEPQLEEMIGRFWATVAQEGNLAQRSLGDASNLLSPGGPGPPPPMSSPGLGKKRKVSLLFDHLETGELAQHLTYLEFRSFQAITPQDLRGYVLQGSVRGSPALEGSVALSNSVSRWVQVMVLSRPGPAQRAQVLDKFIHVAQRLRQLQNFNTLMAVTGGLCHSAISRLKDSNAHLSPDSTKALLELNELLASHNNYACYRRTWARCTGFRLPVLGVHLKDLVSLHEAQPDRLPDGRLHLSKLNSLYLRLQELAALQGQQPPCNANEDLLHLLTLSLDLFYTEDEIYELSYAREPRCPKSLLWGVTKQGYRCRDCGLCCHKHCRDQVKVECKKRPGVKGDVGPPGAPVPPIPAANASSGPEENLSYTLSLEPETGCHVRHAWTQTESPHPSWEPETEGNDEMRATKGLCVAEQQGPVQTQGQRPPPFHQTKHP